MTMIRSWRDNCTCEMKIVCKLQHCDTASCLHPLFMPLTTLCRATSHQRWACLLHDNTTVKCMFLKHRQHGWIVLVKNKLICSKSAHGKHNRRHARVGEQQPSWKWESWTRSKCSDPRPRMLSSRTFRNMHTRESWNDQHSIKSRFFASWNDPGLDWIL